MAVRAYGMPSFRQSMVAFEIFRRYFILSNTINGFPFQRRVHGEPPAGLDYSYH